MRRRAAPATTAACAVADFVAPDASVTSKPAVKQLQLCIGYPQDRPFENSELKLIPLALPAGGSALFSYVQTKNWAASVSTQIHVLLHSQNAAGTPLAPIEYASHAEATGAWAGNTPNFEHATVAGKPGFGWFVHGFGWGGNSGVSGMQVAQHGVDPAQKVLAGWVTAQKGYVLGDPLHIQRVRPAAVNGLWALVTWRKQASALAATAGGQFRVGWHVASLDASGFGVQVQPLTAAAKATGVRIQVNRTTTGSRYAPALAWLQGGMLTAWLSEGQDGSGAAVVYRVLP